MDRVRDGELSESLRLQLYQVFASVIHGAGHPSVFPLGVVHLRQSLQLLANLVRGPAFLGQLSVPYDTGPGRNELLLQLHHRLLYLSLHLFSHTGQAQEYAIEYAPRVLVAVDG